MSVSDPAGQPAVALDPAITPVPAAASGFSRTFSALSNPHFRILWFSMTFHFIGLQISQIANQWLVFQLTGSSTLLGITNAVSLLPTLLLSIPGGAIADRIARKRLLIITQTSTGLTALAMALLLMTNLIEVWHVMAIGFISGIIFCFNAPGRQALISELVEPRQLMNAIALSTLAMNLTRVIGPSIAGLMVAALGLTMTYYIYAAQYVFAVGLLFLLPAAATVVRHRQSSAVEDMAEGALFVWRHQTMFVLLVFITLTTMFGWNYQTLMPVMSDQLGVGAAGFGVMMGAVGVGALLGAVLVAWLGDFRRKGWLMLGTGFLFGVTLVLFAYVPNYFAGLAALVAVGVCSTACNSVNNVLVQTLAPETMQGRIMGIYILTWGLSPLGNVPAGWLGDIIGVPHVLAISGVLTSLTAVGTFVFFPAVRRL